MERLPEVVESIVIGQEWQNDVRVVLFVRLREGLVLDNALVQRIQRTIRQNNHPGLSWRSTPVHPRSRTHASRRNARVRGLVILTRPALRPSRR